MDMLSQTLTLDNAYSELTLTECKKSLNLLWHCDQALFIISTLQHPSHTAPVCLGFHLLPTVENELVTSPLDCREEGTRGSLTQSGDSFTPSFWRTCPLL